MARYRTGSLSSTSPPASGPPCAFGLWVVPTSLQTVGLMELRDASSRLIYITLVNDGRVGAIAFDGTNYRASYSTNRYVLNAWNYIGGNFTSTSSRAAILNGVIASPNNVAASFGPATSVTVLPSVSNAVAHAAVWSTALTANEASSLYSGASPLLIRPASLAAYWPLRGLECDRPEVDVVRRRDLTVNGTTWAPDPPACLAHPVVAPPVHPLLESAPPAWHSRPVPALLDLPVAPQSSGRPKKWFPGLVRPRLSSGS